MTLRRYQVCVPSTGQLPPPLAQQEEGCTKLPALRQWLFHLPEKDQQSKVSIWLETYRIFWTRNFSKHGFIKEETISLYNSRLAWEIAFLFPLDILRKTSTSLIDCTFLCCYVEPSSLEKKPPLSPPASRRGESLPSNSQIHWGPATFFLAFKNGSLYLIMVRRGASNAISSCSLTNSYSNTVLPIKRSPLQLRSNTANPG